VENLSKNMAKRKTDWLTYKKQLPKNWIQEAQKLIADKGFTMTDAQIRDTRFGSITDTQKQELVWSAIKDLKKNHQKKKKKLQKLTALD
jgi:hypothetical protein